jgi:hypothetical protein
VRPRELVLAAVVALGVALFELGPAATGLGAYLVARHLRIGSLGAALSGVSFGGSGLVLFRPALDVGPRPGVIAVGVLLIAVAFVSSWKRWPAGWARWLGVPLVAAALVFVAQQFGAPWLALAPESLGLPGVGRGYLGTGSFEDRCAAFVSVPTLAFALVAALGRGREGLAAAAFATFLLAVGGWGLAVVPSAFLLALLAGYGLEAFDRKSEVAAVLTCAVLGASVLQVDAELLDVPRPAGDPPDELVERSIEPDGTYFGMRGVLQLEGVVHPSVGASDVRVRMHPGALACATEVVAADDGLRFVMAEIDVRGLANGFRHLEIDILGADGGRLGSRNTATFLVRHPVLPDITGLLALLVLFALPLAPRGRMRRAVGGLLVALAALQSVALLLR